MGARAAVGGVLAAARVQRAALSRDPPRGRRLSSARRSRRAREPDPVPLPLELASSRRFRSSATSTIRRSRPWRAPSASSPARHRAGLGRSRRRARAPDASKARGVLERELRVRAGTTGVARHQLRRRSPGRPSPSSGQTGSGKTSIVNLVAKLYLPSAGEVSIDRRDLATVTGQSLHRQIASVTQENFLFSGTVIENIRLGKPGSDARRGARGGAGARRAGSVRRARCAASTRRWARKGRGSRSASGSWSASRAPCSPIRES